MKENRPFFKRLLYGPENKLRRIHLLAFLVFLVLNLSIPPNDKWVEFSDGYDYLAQSKISLFNSRFFSPTTSDVHYPRAFSIPLLFKLAGSDPHNIVIVQRSCTR